MIQQRDTQFYHANESIQKPKKKTQIEKELPKQKLTCRRWLGGDKNKFFHSRASNHHQKAKGNARDMAGDGGEGVQKANEYCQKNRKHQAFHFLQTPHQSPPPLSLSLGKAK